MIKLTEIPQAFTPSISLKAIDQFKQRNDVNYDNLESIKIFKMS